MPFVDFSFKKETSDKVRSWFEERKIDIRNFNDGDLSVIAYLSRLMPYAMLYDGTEIVKETKVHEFLRSPKGQHEFIYHGGMDSDQELISVCRYCDHKFSSPKECEGLRGSHEFNPIIPKGGGLREGKFKDLKCACGVKLTVTM